MKEKIIIDTDPGVDDTLAIFYALESRKFDLLGLTTVFGNVNTDLATLNTLRLMEIAGRTDIPVYAGAQTPIIGQYLGPVPHVHGDDGQGNTHLPLPKIHTAEGTAVQFIVEQIMNQPDEITLVPIGPLTNIALAIRLQPRIIEKVKRVVLMGGAALVPGNYNPAAEANIYNDPEAADIVMTAAWDVTMVGLDVTHQVLMSNEQLSNYGRSSKATSQHISKIIPHYEAFAYQVGMSGMYMHDPTAISYLLAPSLFEVKRYPLRVETLGISRGKTWVWTDTKDFPPEEFGYDTNNPVSVVLGADVEAVNQMLLETV
ncbi:MAG: nucleoside hydrolase [Anaerolineaceae bacterium]|nr:nucleoside hydrolase [Anaerolineaceae bacterium]